MPRSRVTVPAVATVSRWRRGATRLASLCMTIRGRILVAFLVMSMITAALGGYAIMGIKNAGLLVGQDLRRIPDVDQLRARGGDRLRRHARCFCAALDRRRSRPCAPRSTTRWKISACRCRDDLKIAAARSQSARAARAAENVQRAVDAWKSMCDRLIDGHEHDVNWDTLDHYAGKVDEQIDLLGQLHRGRRTSSIGRSRARRSRTTCNSTIAGTALAMLLSAMVAWALARRIVGPVAVASGVAERIAAASSTSRSRAAAPTNSARCSPPWARCATTSRP